MNSQMHDINGPAYTSKSFQQFYLHMQDQENPIWIPERLTRFIRHEDPDPDTSDKPDSSPDQSRTGDAVVGSDQNVADPDATECWNGTWTSAVIVKVPTFVPILVKVDPKTFPIMTLLRERRDFGITAAIIAAIVLSAAGAITAAVAITNQVQSAQTINTVVEQTSTVMETQHQINKHLMFGIVAANQRMDLIQTQVEELFGLIQIRCIAKLKHMCVTPLRFDEAGNESRMIASYLAGNWTRDAELLMSQQLLQIAALNETRVEPISLGDFTDWLSSAFSFFKEWVGVGIFGAICCFGVVLCLWFLCRLRARQVRDKAVIIQALAALEHGVSPQDNKNTHLPEVIRPWISRCLQQKERIYWYQSIQEYVASSRIKKEMLEYSTLASARGPVLSPGLSDVPSVFSEALYFSTDLFTTCPYLTLAALFLLH
ncbi:hypothetical protein STEG23_026294 [Scotinomys teguina]